ncbi:hypothetical protein [Pontibacter actiniarum]|uniref:Uncharacterized protein n=1 Tax=Pontibacter actiniarum TaxID=323450 RepID=A0A1X9YS26_9BACT|nr:hypothetical protein [Pontibacter actiniarum]ARS35658.1 hypothetical protein CA264_09515 [Pontibacter actiniarum]
MTTKTNNTAKPKAETDLASFPFAIPNTREIALAEKQSKDLLFSLLQKCLVDQQADKAPMNSLFSISKVNFL